jgi:RNA polymerase sigma-70 factor (ECF subfamily)
MYIEENESQLIQKVRQGNREAMDRLYRRYAGLATAVVLRYLPSHDEAKDVLHDSFLKIFTRIGQFQFKGEGSLKAWILRICANEAIDYLRKEKKLTFSDSVPDVPDDAEPEVERVPAGVLNSMIGQLPSGYRTVLNLYVFEQLSHKEIAQRLGIKEDTSASQFSRAKRQLAKMIQEYIKKQG